MNKKIKKHTLNRFNVLEKSYLEKAYNEGIQKGLKGNELFNYVEEIRNRKEIKLFPVSFPCAEQGFLWNSSGTVVRSLHNVPKGVSNEFRRTKKRCAISFDIRNLFN